DLAGLDVLQLRAHDRAALAGLVVLEPDDLPELAVEVEDHAVLEVVGGGHARVPLLLGNGGPARGPFDRTSRRATSGSRTAPPGSRNPRPGDGAAPYVSAGGASGSRGRRTRRTTSQSGTPMTAAATANGSMAPSPTNPPTTTVTSACQPCWKPPTKPPVDRL